MVFRVGYAVYIYVILYLSFMYIPVMSVRYCEVVKNSYGMNGILELKEDFINEMMS